MGKKRDKANENIGELIEMLISAKKSALGSGNCPHAFYGQRDNKSDSCDDCYGCKEQYFEDMREQLLKEYIVK